MLWQKKKSTPLQECAKCASSTTHNGTLYCTLMLQDAKIYKDSGKYQRNIAFGLNIKR